MTLLSAPHHALRGHILKTSYEYLRNILSYLRKYPGNDAHSSNILGKDIEKILGKCLRTLFQTADMGFLTGVMLSMLPS